MKVIDRALIYAAAKLLDRMDKQNIEAGNNLPPGYELDLTGYTITIKFAPGTKLNRESGVLNDGVVMKKATQDLYGFGVWAALIERLKKFNQWNVVQGHLIEAMKTVLRQKAQGKDDEKMTEAALIKRDKTLADAIQQLREEFPIPDREEDTPRKVKGLAPTIDIITPK